MKRTRIDCRDRHIRKGLALLPLSIAAVFSVADSVPPMIENGVSDTINGKKCHRRVAEPEDITTNSDLGRKLSLVKRHMKVVRNPTQKDQSPNPMTKGEAFAYLNRHLNMACLPSSCAEHDGVFFFSGGTSTREISDYSSGFAIVKGDSRIFSWDETAISNPCTEEFAPAVSELSDGALPRTAKPEERIRRWKKDKERYTLPPAEDGLQNKALPVSQEASTAKLQGAMVSDAEHASRLAMDAYLHRVTGLSAMEAPSRPVLVELGFPVKGYSNVGDKVWEVRITMLTQDGNRALRAIVWIHSQTGRPYFPCSPCDQGHTGKGTSTDGAIDTGGHI